MKGTFLNSIPMIEKSPTATDLCICVLKYLMPLENYLLGARLVLLPIHNRIVCVKQPKALYLNEFCFFQLEKQRPYYFLIFFCPVDLSSFR